MKDVQIKNLPNQLSELIHKSDVFNEIATKSTDPNESLAELKTFNSESLKKIADFMPVINEKTNVFGRTNSFTSNKLMTLQMLSRGSSMRVLRQCLSQIERKRAAVKETLTKLKKEQLKAKKLLGDIEDIDYEINELNNKIKELETEDISSVTELTNSQKTREYKKRIRLCEYDKELLKIKLEEIKTATVETRTYLEGAFKEIASFQEAYKQIVKNKKIKEDWDENDFEKMESRYHVRHSFSNGYRDIKASGKFCHGTLEHLEQFGVNPEQAEMEIHKYISNMNNKLYKKITDENGNTLIVENGKAEFNDFETWLDSMEEKYCNNYKDAMTFLGLDSINENWYTYQSQLEE